MMADDFDDLQELATSNTTASSSDLLEADGSRSTSQSDASKFSRLLS